MVGSLDAYTLEPSPGLLEKLDDAGRAELDAYVASQKKQSADAHLAYVARTMPTNALDLAHAVEDGKITPDDAWRASALSALHALTKALGGSPAVVTPPPAGSPAEEPTKSDNVLYLVAVLAVAWLAAQYAAPLASWLSSLWR